MTSTPTTHPPNLRKLFIDSSVFFAMADSATGASRELFQRAVRGQVELVVSNFVLRETEEKLILKRPATAVESFRRLRDQKKYWHILDPSREDVIAAIESHCTPDIDDTPIVAAAKHAKVDTLVSLDRKHILRQSVADYISAVVATPEQVIKQLRANDETTK